MQAHKPGVPPARAVPHSTSKSITHAQQFDCYLQARRTKKTRMANTNKLTDSRSMPAHNAGVWPARAVPAGTARRKHNPNISQRLTHTLQTPRAKKTRPPGQRRTGVKHCKPTQRLQGTNTTASRAARTWHHHSACAPLLCSATLHNSVRQYPLSKSIAILGENFDHFFLEKGKFPPARKLPKSLRHQKQILACRPTALL